MTDESKQLYNSGMVGIRQRPEPRYDRIARLGEVVGQLMDSRILPRQARFGMVAELWGRLLPVELRRHCEVADISGGQLKVRVDSPAYASELRLCCPRLLEELQRQCPRVKIKRVKFILDDTVSKTG